METFTLHITSPTGTTTQDITWLEITTPTSNLTIQKGHAPLVCLLKPEHDLVYQDATGKEERRLMYGGIVHVERDKVTILAEK